MITVIKKLDSEETNAPITQTGILQGNYTNLEFYFALFGGSKRIDLTASDLTSISVFVQPQKTKQVYQIAPSNIAIENNMVKVFGNTALTNNYGEHLIGIKYHGELYTFTTTYNVVQNPLYSIQPITLPDSTAPTKNDLLNLAKKDLSNVATTDLDRAFLLTNAYKIIADRQRTPFDKIVRATEKETADSVDISALPEQIVHIKYDIQKDNSHIVQTLPPVASGKIIIFEVQFNGHSNCDVSLQGANGEQFNGVSSPTVLNENGIQGVALPTVVGEAILPDQTSAVTFWYAKANQDGTFAKIQESETDFFLPGNGAYPRIYTMNTFNYSANANDILWLFAKNAVDDGAFLIIPKDTNAPMVETNIYFSLEI